MKKRGRKPGKKSQQKLFSKRGVKWLECKNGCGMEELVDSDTKTVVCGLCVQLAAGAPTMPKTTISDEEKKLRAERKIERAKKKEAKKKGIKLPERTDLGFTRGWHLKKLFKVEVNGKLEYYSKGQKITKSQATKLEKEINTPKETKSTGFPRGWHFKKEFIAPNGDIYSKGVLLKKSPGRLKKSKKRR